MKVLVFHIGSDRYGLRLVQLNRVLPLVALKQLPLAPPYVAGLMDLHGQPVPVIDLNQLAGLASGDDFYDTRILIADYRTADGAVHALGLLARHVRGVQQVALTALADSGVANSAAPFLGQVASDADGMLQLIELDQLLTAEVRQLLFPTVPA
jgi:chemotaxis-related protein WspB